MAYDPYAILGVEPNASTTSIRRAYHAHCLRLHPDKRGDSGGREQLAAVQAAFHELIRRAQREEQHHSADLSNYVVCDEITVLQFKDDGNNAPCRCGGAFTASDDVISVNDLVVCDTCSLAIRILR